MAGESSQQTYFSFAGAAFTATSITVNNGNEREFVPVAHMGLGPNDVEQIVRLHKTAASLPTIDLDFIGSSAPTIDTIGSLSITGKISFSATVVCTASQVTAAFGDIIRGSASFRVSSY
jgi:hypothetical protein